MYIENYYGPYNGINGFKLLSAVLDYRERPYDINGDPTKKTLILFQFLVDTGLAWTLNDGEFREKAEELIEAGLIRKSEINYNMYTGEKISVDKN